jgi:hypothetical protein
MAKQKAQQETTEGAQPARTVQATQAPAPAVQRRPGPGAASRRQAAAAAGGEGGGNGMGAAPRARGSRAMQRQAGNARLSWPRGGVVQPKLTVNQPGDVYEQEADRVAAQVMRMSRPAPVASGTKTNPPDQGRVMRLPARDAPGRQVTPAVESSVRGAGGGRPLSPAVRGAVEPRLGQDLSGVRVHSGPDANRAAASIGARAFTHRDDIFLGGGESSSDLGLMAHETTHVAQQRSQPSELASRVQALLGFSLDDIPGVDAADIARRVPGYDLFTVVIQYNPLTGQHVDFNAINLLRGLMGLVPFGADIFDALNERGIIQAVFNWVNDQLNRLNLTIGRVEGILESAWERIDLPAFPSTILNIVVDEFRPLYNDAVAFAGSLVDHIIEMIKDAALDLAEGFLADNRAWDLIKKILGYDPLRDQEVSATPAEILEEFLLLIGKEQEVEQMKARGTLEETANWLATQLAIFIGLLAELRTLIVNAWEAIQPENLPNLVENLRGLAVQVGGFLQRVWDFAYTVAAKVLELIKNALLGWLSSFVHEVPGFHLLTVIIGQDPFTGERVLRTPENLIRGFITLLPGGGEIYERLAESGTIAEAGARIEGAMASLGISLEFIVGLFTGIWQSLSIEDLIHPIEAFVRIRDQFGEPIARLFAFVNVVLREVFMLILEIMNFPTDLVASIISNAMQAIAQIRQDPIGFILNMLRAVKLGFENFFHNILQHLVGGLAAWLFRGLRDAGIEPPTDLSLGSVLDFVLQVLGISMERIWQKLAERVGQEMVDRIRGAIDRLTGIWNFVRDVQQRGVAAIWEYIESQISNLWDMILEKAQEWIMERIINRAIQWLVSLLDPTGVMAVIRSFQAFFNAVQSAIEYLRDILAIINDYVSTIAAIARGAIEAGAQKLEQGLANAIPVAIGFLANQFGLGDIGAKIQEIVGGIREVVDRALDWLLDRAVSAGRSVLGMFGFGGTDEGAGAETEAVPEADPSDHVAFARHAANMLKEAPLGEGGSFRESAERFAAEKEPVLSAQLGEGIGLNFVFSEAAEDGADRALDFRVVIAPNDTTVEDELPVPEDACFSPRASAPGIGDVARHGAQGSSLRDEEPIWWLESEHILPFATGRYLWEALALYLPQRGWREDRQQTTIMIYYGAARIKTPQDNRISERFSASLAGLNIALMFQTERERYEAGDESALASGRDILERVLRPLNQARQDAVARTNEAIVQENRSIEEGCTETNGERRAVSPNAEPPLPSPAAVASAARQQYDDILGLVAEEVLSAAERRRRIDRLLGRE